MTELGVIIVTFNNTVAQLNACLQSVRANHVTDIVVIDNGRSAELKKLCYKQSVRYRALSDNHGFATAANSGANHLTNPYLLFLNPDATLQNPATTQVIDYFNQHPSVGIVGLRLTSPTDIPELTSFGPLVSPATLITRQLHRQSLPQHPQVVGWVSGGALAIRREVYQASGGFDPRFFLYWEDVDLCRRVSNLGWHVTLLPNAKVQHQRGASHTDNITKTAQYDQSADRYFRKHYPKAVWFTQRYLRLLYRRYSPQAH